MFKFLFGFIVGFLLGVAGTTARAAEIGVHVGSVHVPARDYFNGNIGLYVRSDSGIELGYYKNSIRRDSFYLAQQFDVGPFQVAVGGVTGYQKKCRQDTYVSTGDFVTPSGRTVKRTVTTKGPEICRGQSRGYVMPFIAPSYAFDPVMGLTPRVTVFFGGKSTVAHLGLERSF